MVLTDWSGCWRPPRRPCRQGPNHKRGLGLEHTEDRSSRKSSWLLEPSPHPLMCQHISYPAGNRMRSKLFKQAERYSKMILHGPLCEYQSHIRITLCNVGPMRTPGKLGSSQMVAANGSRARAKVARSP